MSSKGDKTNIVQQIKGNQDNMEGSAKGVINKHACA
jgi:hypothetical protein